MKGDNVFSFFLVVIDLLNLIDNCYVNILLGE